MSSCGYCHPGRPQREKKHEKRDNYLYLARELKKTVEHEGDGETTCRWCTWNVPQRTGRTGNQKIFPFSLCIYVCVCVRARACAYVFARVSECVRMHVGWFIFDITMEMRDVRLCYISQGRCFASKISFHSDGFYMYSNINIWNTHKNMHSHTHTHTRVDHLMETLAVGKCLIHSCTRVYVHVY